MSAEVLHVPRHTGQSSPCKTPGVLWRDTNMPVAPGQEGVVTQVLQQGFDHG